jgi:hypothetical protein
VSKKSKLPATRRKNEGKLVKPDPSTDLVSWIAYELNDFLFKLGIATEAWVQYAKEYLPMIMAAKSATQVINFVRFLDLPKDLEDKVIEWVYEIFSKI